MDWSAVYLVGGGIVALTVVCFRNPNRLEIIKSSLLAKASPPREGNGTRGVNQSSHIS